MKPEFKCYGENSFTFILFQSLATDGGRLNSLLSRLKSFGDAKTLSPDLAQGSQIWLFPNFGKSQGFGEPDALVLADGHSFWFEVETSVDFQKRATATRNSLRQLLRFRLLADALSRRSGVRTASADTHLAYSGPTIRNNGDARLGVLRKAGKPVVQALADPVEQSVHAGKDHYVLLTEKKPDGISALGKDCLQDVISTDFEVVETWCDETGYPKPVRPSIDKFWYVYWNGDLNQHLEPDLLTSGGYVSIAS